jgi:hypothetical protein
MNDRGAFRLSRREGQVVVPGTEGQGDRSRVGVSGADGEDLRVARSGQDRRHEPDPAGTHGTGRARLKPSR